MLVALDVMRMLVSTERASQELNQELDTARAMEESLSERITTLETELSISNSQSRYVQRFLGLPLKLISGFSASTYDFQCERPSLHPTLFS